jgi:tetrahydromethanopterin S-methyltransferase subunit F
VIEWILGGASALTSGLGVLLGYKNYQLSKKISNLNLISQILSKKQDTDLNLDILDFNKNMANLQMIREDTAVQRYVEDLKRAGLSPILAAGGVASTSSYQTSFAPSTAPILANDYQFDISSIMQFSDILGNLALKKEQANLLSTQSKLNDINAALLTIDLQFRNIEKSLDKTLKEKGIELSNYQIEKIKSEIPSIQAQVELITQQTLLTKKDVSFYEAEKGAIKILKERIMNNKKLSENQKMIYMILLESLDIVKNAVGGRR